MQFRYEDPTVLHLSKFLPNNPRTHALGNSFLSTVRSYQAIHLLVSSAFEMGIPK